MKKEIRMPKLAQTVNEYIVQKINAKEGDPVEMGDILIEVETDKSILPVEAYLDGMILEICVEQGDTILEGDVFAVIDSEED